MWFITGVKKQTNIDTGIEHKGTANTHGDPQEVFVVDVSAFVCYIGNTTTM